MEMRTFVLTFPLFSEYDLISRRKRHREKERGKKRSGKPRKEEENRPSQLTVKRERATAKICEKRNGERKSAKMREKTRNGGLKGR